MKKKIIALLLVVMTVTCSTMPVCAETASTELSATVESWYRVAMPATLALDKDTENIGSYGIGTTTFKNNYTGKVAGNIPGNKKVYITPQNNTFTMANADDSTFNASATITPTKDNWSSTELEGTPKEGVDGMLDVTGLVSVGIQRAGAYSGTVVFEYGLQDA